MAHKSDTEITRNTHNTSRFFVEKRHIGLVLLAGVMFWGWYGYGQMPKRKDPDLPVRVAVAACPWPGVRAEQVEQLVTRRIEEVIAQNAHVHPPETSSYGIRSITLPGLSIVYVQLTDGFKETKKEFSDINLKLDTLSPQLPQGAGPIQFNSDFGDTVALMLTVASPPASEIEIDLRTRDIKKAIAAARPAHASDRLSFIYSFPLSVAADTVRRPFTLFARSAEKEGMIGDVRFFDGDGFIGFDAASDRDPAVLLKYADWFIHERLQRAEIHSDAWQPIVVRDPDETRDRLNAGRGAKYSYRELDNFTDLIGRTLLGAPQTSRVDRSGVLPEQIYLDYSQQRLASYGLQPQRLREVLAARNIALPGGVVEASGKNVIIDPSGQFRDAASIGEVILGKSKDGSPVYLRDLADISRGYQSPARFLNFYSWRDAGGEWRRSRAITIGVQMKPGEQIGKFAENVDARLAAVLKLLPDDLIVSRTSDQPKQVREKIDLFMDALYEAIILVVLVSLLGFWEWRSALLMALSIPITLAMTFGMMHLLKIDVQQISIASLIIALGLLVDDPIVAADSIKRSLADGEPSLIAAWLGPTKLARAIMYATLTNIVAYLPLLMLKGIVGEFIFSLPIVISCSLVASRIVSMTFIPLLAFFLLKPSKKPQASIEERRSSGFSGRYYQLVGRAIAHRWKVAFASLGVLILGGVLFSRLKTQFFPDDVQYWAYMDVWLPNDAPLASTNETAQQVERVVLEAATKFDQKHAEDRGKQPELLKSLTTFVGGGGPRFWFSVSPELPQLNYAEVVLEIRNKDVMPELVDVLQEAVSKTVPGAYVDVRQLQNTPVEVPVEIRISAQADADSQHSAEDIRTLRAIAGDVKAVFAAIPIAKRVRGDWFPETSKINLSVDPDRANLAGISNLDVATSSTTAISGSMVTTLREGNKDIPVVARLRMEERSQLSDIESLYAYSSTETQRVPLVLISNFNVTMDTERIRRLEHFRTISVRGFPAAGYLPSQVLKAAMPGITEIKNSLPPGYALQIGGDDAKQKDGFGDLAIALSVSVFAIFLALVMQFNHAVKPLLVFAAVPFGVVGAAAALFVMHTPFGFMAFLGITSLIGVIVSHVIVLFDFIEEMHERGEPLEQALADAGIVRLRPVLITVGATVLALFPLALHGGPLWKPLCYAQMGGLFAATFITLLLVPVLYAIFVLDLKVVRWQGREQAPVGIGTLNAAT